MPKDTEWRKQQISAFIQRSSFCSEILWVEFYTEKVAEKLSQAVLLKVYEETHFFFKKNY